MLKLIALFLLLILAPVGYAGAASGPVAADEATKLFDAQKVHAFHLTLAPKDWASMQPLAPSAPTSSLRNESGDGQLPTQLGSSGAASASFSYVHADLEFEGKTYKDIGIRFKGSSSYRIASASRKFPFKLDFNRFVEDQRFLGLNALNLNNNAMDPSYMRDFLAYAAFRQAEVPLRARRLPRSISLFPANTTANTLAFTPWPRMSTRHFSRAASGPARDCCSSRRAHAICRI